MLPHVLSVSLLAILYLPLTVVSAAAGAAQNDTWWSCLQKNRRDANQEFMALMEKDYCGRDNGDRVGLFNTIMYSTEACHFADPSAQNREVMRKSDVMLSLCDESKPLYVLSSPDQHLSFPELTGVWEGQDCDAGFQAEMEGCTRARDLDVQYISLYDYVNKFCMNYEETRSCYLEVTERMCTQSDYLVPYERTEVAFIEEMCNMAVRTASSTLASLLALFAIKSLF